MTHSLHRQGCVDSLREDFVVLVLGGHKNIVKKSEEHLMREHPRMFKLLRDIYHKSGVSWILKNTGIRKFKKTNFKVSTLLNSREELYRYLKTLKEADTGKSVVVSSLFDDISDCCKKLDLIPHTVQFSLGYFGKTELLPDKKVMEITSMCGHHLISSRLVERMVKKMEKDKTVPEEAAEIMGKQCVCGIFNRPRATALLKEMGE
ncbi:MAG: hypothetical protein JRG81_16405 [Deltaproteobacteria bacterium]|nr:hypothetical protein [Deltaproteobacteria bacterium]